MDPNDRKKVVPRVCIIGGKAAPGYEMAKKVIKLCHAVAERINKDNDIGDLLKLVREDYSGLTNGYFFLKLILPLQCCPRFLSQITTCLLRNW